MARQGEEREISLIDLCVHILLRWRTILVWILIGAVLFGGYSYYSSLQARQQQSALVESQKDRETALIELKSMLTIEQQNNVNMLLQYEAFDDYFNQSELMKINPAEVPCSKLLYMVKSESIEESENIRLAYEKFITSGFFYWLKNNTDVDAQPEMMELILVNKSDERVRSLNQEEGIPLESNFVPSATNGTLLEISIVHSSIEECTKLSSCLKEYIDQNVMLMQKKVGEHELVYLSETFEVVSDSGLLEIQNQMLETIIAAHKNVKTLRDGFTDVEERYYNLLTSEEELSTVVVQSPFVRMKHVVMGMVIMAFAYVFIVFIAYILNTKIRIEDDMTSVFGVTQLGTIRKTLSNKKIFWKIDSLIQGVQDRNKRIFSEEETIGLAVSAIKIATKKQELSKVLCMGTAWNEKTTDIIEKMKALLEKDGIEVQLASNVLYNRESMELLAGVAGAFLLECADVTRYDEIWQELDLLQRQEIECLGILVVEG